MTSYLTTQSIEPEDEADDTVDDSGVTYFVDDDGRYYYQPNSAEGDSGIVALDVENIPQELEAQPQPIENLIVPDTDANFTQTVALVPSENADGEITYVLVVADDNEELEKMNINVETNQTEEQSEEAATIQEVHIIQQDENEEGGEEREDEPGDVYKFQDDEEFSVEEEEDEEKKKTVKKKRSKRAPDSHLTQLLFTCTFCKYKSHRRYLLLRHMKCHSNERPYKCNICERGFKTQAALQNHVNMHNGIKPHSCTQCESTFTTSGELVRHVRYKHTHEKPHKCTECDYASVELSKLRRHERCHTGERPYQCPHCTYASPDTFKLKRHLRTHSGEKPYKCDQCSLCFTQSNSLKAHKLIHNVEKKPVFACELCPAKCGRKTDLRIHVQKLHTSIKPLQCKRCGKSFPDRYSCKMHNKTHDGEKCFKCDICPYASTTMRHLKSHLLKHTDEKPFACEFCDQTFRQKQLLRRHQNLYHNPNYVPKPPKEKNHRCHVCHRTFAHKGNLMRHLAVHDPDSGHHERALALKVGRQIRAPSRFQNITTARRYAYDPDEEENQLVTMSDDDGEQYVVLEVIQLGDGTKQQVAVVAPDYMQATQMREGYMKYQEDDSQAAEEEDEEDRKYKEDLLQQQLAIERTNDIKKDVVTCFGFDEVDEEEDEEEEEEVELATAASPFAEKVNSESPPRHSTVFETRDDDESDKESGNGEEQEIVYELV